MTNRIIGDAAVIQLFKALPGDVRGKVIEGIGRSALRLQARVMRDKLSGQVLNVRTGTLRRSIDKAVIERPGEVLGVVGTNVEYAAGHENGFSGTVSVRAHLRLIKQAFGKSLRAPVSVQVRAHAVKRNLPARSFLRSALEDHQGEFFAEMDRAAQEVAK